MKIEETFRHRAPFLFVDEIVEMKYLEYSKGKKMVKDDEFWVEAHFPDDPMFPGVLLLETMAQVGGLVLIPTGQKTIDAYLSKVDNFKLIEKVIPGDELVVEGVFLEQLGYFAKVKTKAFVNGVRVGEAEITYVPRNKLKGDSI
jgi:3-hydroxymyristoyl/3-hydroxydecanoyl-(acyl carrier protein) dehydratase